MKVSQDTFGAGYAIRAYTATSVTVIGPAESPVEGGNPIPYTEELTASFIITPQELRRGWPPRSYSELASDHITALLELGPEIVLLGTGATFRYPSPALLAPLINRGIGVEVMDSGAACRTYNILAAEDRQVVAAILLDHPAP